MNDGIVRIGTSGMKSHPLYNTWNLMLQRCYNERNHKYPSYGGRGIRVCARWHDIRNFVEDMGDRPKGMSVDRRNNDRDYKPSNCRWATAKQQANNRRPRRGDKNAVMLTHRGVTKNFRDWCESVGVSHSTALKRRRRGWSSHEILHGKS